MKKNADAESPPRHAIEPKKAEDPQQMSGVDTPTETKQTLTEEPKAAAEGAKPETDANSKLRRRRPGVSATIPNLT